MQCFLQRVVIPLCVQDPLGFVNVALLYWLRFFILNYGSTHLFHLLYVVISWDDHSFSGLLFVLFFASQPQNAKKFLSQISLGSHYWSELVTCWKIIEWMEQFGYSNINLHIFFMCFLFDITICNVFEWLGISEVNEGKIWS